MAHKFLLLRHASDRVHFPKILTLFELKQVNFEFYKPSRRRKGAKFKQDYYVLTQVGEQIRRNAPAEMQCSMFCGGKRCKYEAGPSSWQPKDMAIDGIYSHWITGQLTVKWIILKGLQ